VVDGGNDLHHVKREGELSGRRSVRLNMSMGYRPVTFINRPLLVIRETSFHCRS